MKVKPATRGKSATATLINRLASSIESDPRLDVDAEPDAAAALLVHHLSTKLAEDDLAAVADFLSSALDLAKEKLRDTGVTPVPVAEPNDPSYWLG